MNALRFREPRIDDPKLRELCHQAPHCFIRIQDVCTYSPTECVHSDAGKHGRGFSHKSHDFNTLPGCRPCHEAYGTNQDDLQQYVDEGLENWRYYLHRNRLLRVA
jgi:hypothetical protein